MSSLLSILKNNTSAFRHVMISAFVMGIGTVFCSLVDLGWVIGDMSASTHWYHWFVMVGLVIGNVIVLVSFIWLVKGVVTYDNNHSKVIITKNKTKRKMSKQTEVIMHLNKRIDELEERLDSKG